MTFAKHRAMLEEVAVISVSDRELLIAAITPFISRNSTFNRLDFALYLEFLGIEKLLGNVSQARPLNVDWILEDIGARGMLWPEIRYWDALLQELRFILPHGMEGEVLGKIRACIFAQLRI